MPVDTSSKWGGNLHEENTATIYPNPVDDLLIINLKAFDSEQITIHIHDGFGRAVLTERITGSEDWHTLDVSHLSPGLHILTMMGEEGRQEVAKFIKQ